MGGEDVWTVGIDIGTSTTKVVFSILKVVNTAGCTRVSRMEIVDRNVIYRGPLIKTPLRSEQMIEMEALWKIISGEYAAAGIRMEDIKTGAVIITGDMATKANAREVLTTLADRSGDFVVATAGSDLEGILAGKGSGAREWSRKTGQVTANIDVGGGTANIAVFAYGKVEGTCTLHIGGRMLCFSGGKISYVSKHLKKWLDASGSTLEVGRTANQEVYQLRRFAYGMAEVIANVLNNRLGVLEESLLLGHSPNWSYPVQAIMFSGGVGELLDVLGSRDIPFEQLIDQSSTQTNEFEDSGMILADALLDSTALVSFFRAPAIETSRATVIGVGTQSVEISGTTVHIDHKLLPQKNLPVISCYITSPQTAENEITLAIRKAAAIYDPLGEGVTFALFLEGVNGWGFTDLQILAKSLRRVWNTRDTNRVVVVILDGDIGKALGQSMVAAGIINAVCIDQISVEHGDYIDIGMPLAHTEAVPVLIKTLVIEGERMEVVK